MIEPAQYILHRKPRPIIPFNEDHLTPQGYDLSVEKIEEMNGMGALLVEGKRLPSYEEAHFRDGFYFLKKGVYIVTFAEEVEIPKFQCAFMWSRSSLLRMGASLLTAVWDAGYHGRSQTILEVLNPMGIKVEKGARIGQMVFAELWCETDRPYQGQYQGENT